MSKQPSCEDRIDAQLASTAETFRIYMNDSDVYENGNDDLSPFCEYGLSFDYVEPDTFDDQPQGFYRYQLSYGGPSSEVRFHPDGSIEYRFHDWFDGAGREVTREDWAQWLKEHFSDCEMMPDQPEHGESYS